MATRLVFIRHGESSANACPDSRLQPGHDDDDVALTTKGRAEARECREGLVHKLQLDFENVSVYTSPKLRAIQTSEILGFSNRHIIDARLKEQAFPIFPNKESREFHRSEAKRLGKFHYRYPFPGGESGHDVAVRLSDFLKYLALIDKHDTILIICHEVVIRAAIFLLEPDTTPQVFDRVDIDNCEWVVFNVFLDTFA